MSNGNPAAPPQPKNRAKAGQAAKRLRDDKGRFVKGASGNASGRKKLREEFKQFAQEKSFDALKVVHQILASSSTSNKDRLTAARLLMEYGYGRPVAELDRERLEIDRRRLDMEIAKQEQKDEVAPIVVEWDGAEEFAK